MFFICPMAELKDDSSLDITINMDNVEIGKESNKKHLKQHGEQINKKLLKQHGEQINIHTKQMRELQLAFFTFNKILHVFKEKGLDSMECDIAALQLELNVISKTLLESKKEHEELWFKMQKQVEMLEAVFAELMTGPLFE